MNDLHESRKEVFRGHFGECIAHFSKRFTEGVGGTPKATVVKKIIGDFCKVRTAAVQLWISGRAAPFGQRHFNMICYLDIMGYRIIELEQMAQTKRKLLELIGFNVISLEEACDIVGYKNTWDLSQVLRGNENTSREKEARMYEAWKTRREQLENAKQLLASKRELCNVDKTMRSALPGEIDESDLAKQIKDSQSAPKNAEPIMSPNNNRVKEKPILRLVENLPSGDKSETVMNILRELENILRENPFSLYEQFSQSELIMALDVCSDLSALCAHALRQQRIAKEAANGQR